MDELIPARFRGQVAIRGRYWIVPILGSGAAIEEATGQHHLTNL